VVLSAYILERFWLLTEVAGLRRGDRLVRIQR
jgi:hypothetical protein